MSKAIAPSSSPSPSRSLTPMHPDAAGIDVGASQIWVAVPSDRHARPVQVFPTFSHDLYRLADFLRDCGIRTVAMESTGVYWIPLYNILEARGLEVYLVNAERVKHVPGRKSDCQDCQWLQELHTYGLLADSFHPEPTIRVLRSYLRHRNHLGQEMCQQVNRMHKALVLMNLQLHLVLSDITGMTGMAILKAILQGERDPVRLASLKQPGVKSSQEEIAKALEGTYQEDHLFCLQQAVEAYEFYQRQTEACDRQIEALLNRLETKKGREELPPGKRKSQGNTPAFDVRGRLFEISGADLTQIEGINHLSALVIVSEIGLDVSAFPSVKHFTSFLGLAPQRDISGGKVLKGKGRSRRKVVHRVAQVLRMAASTLQRSQGYMGAYFRSMKARLGPVKAVKATARKLAEHVYYLLKYGKEYRKRTAEEYEQLHKERTLRYLEKQSKKIGFQLIPAT